jgi:hypothetical protein
VLSAPVAGTYGLVDYRKPRSERIWWFPILFTAGWYLCLPIADHFDLPWWGKRIEVVSTMLIHEALFIVYLGFGGYRPLLGMLTSRRCPIRWASIGLIALALWCAITSLLSPLPLHDIFRSARLVIIALLLVAITRWATTEPIAVLKTFLFGLLCGTTINLILTIQHPLSLGVLPRLLGQNAPGPPMGIAVSLAAWLLLMSRAKSDVIQGSVAVLVCGAGALISYSKIGMFGAFAGLLSVILVTAHLVWARRGRLLMLLLTTTVLSTIAYFRSPYGGPVYEAWTVVLRRKLESIPYSKSVSTQERWSYVQGVTEIAATRPVGVGYSGFREAMMNTAAYRAGKAADEIPIAEEDSNPHSMFLYYASAGGVVAGVLSLVIFLQLCQSFASGFRSFGATGWALVSLTIAAFLVMAISVPYLLNSPIMIVPAGVAAGMRLQFLAQSERARPAPVPA